ncbi:uncharacterized protein [Halyomorpha halys]
MPLLTGQHEIESCIVLEPPGMQETLFFKRKYAEHPRLDVQLVDPKKNLSAKKMNNIMWLSVESMYNLDSNHFLEDAEHTLVFPMPAISLDEEQALLEDMFLVGEEPYEETKITQSKKSSLKKGKPKSKVQKQTQLRLSTDVPPEKVEIKKPPDLDLIQFDRGIFKCEQTIDIRKKWSSLASINGAPAMTDQRIRTDSGNLTSTIPFDLKKKFRSTNEPRVEWNMIRPLWLHKDLENLFREKIIQYGFWPVELLMLGKMFVEQGQLSGHLRAKIAEEKEVLEDLKTEIDDIFCEFQEIVDILNKIGNEKVKEQIDIAKRLTELETRMQEILYLYEPKQKGNLNSMPFIDQLKEARKKWKSAKEEGADSGSEINEGPKEFLNQDDIVILERKAYVAWVDLSPLLVPGCTHIRTAGIVQYFNREEAIAKWGLTTTISGDPDEMNTRDKELSVLLMKDQVDLNKIYANLKKSDLIKSSTSLLLLLGRLLEMSYGVKQIESEQAQLAEPVSEIPISSHDITELEDKKRKKLLKFHGDEKKIVKGGKISKSVSQKNGQLKTDSTNVPNTDHNSDNIQNTDWLKMKAFDVNEIRQPNTGKIEKSTPKIPKSVSTTNSEDQSIEEEENTLKTRAMKHYLNRPASHSQNVFAVYKTSTETEGKPIKPLKKHPFGTEENSPTESMESVPMESSAKSSPSGQKNIPFLVNKSVSESKTKYKSDQNPTPQSSNYKQQELKTPGSSVQSLPKKTSSYVHGSFPSLSMSDKEPLLELLKSLLVNITDKYHKLKERYQILKAKKGETSLETSDEETDKDGKNKGAYLHDESGIIKVEPRHKMWQIGQNLSDDILENQIGYTNDIRKMAVLEREFLLLKRLRLSQMKNEWEEKLRDIIPEYFENSKGEKVVVIIEIKLLKPLVPKPALTEIDLNIQEFVKDKNPKKKPLCHVNDTVEEFHNCIMTLADLITSEYQDYKKSYSTMMDPLAGETGNEFYSYLEKSRAHQVIAESLSEGMKGYLATALRDAIPSADKPDQKKLRYYVGWLYARIVDEMQGVVNKFTIEGDHSLPESNFGDMPNISSYDLYLFAVEAIEEMDYERAKYYLSKRLDGDKKSIPLPWIEYAVVALRIGDYQLATECLKEALILDSRSKEGLILYAVMLMIEGRFEDAQLFFNALISFYPMFVEGWMAFHMFYLIVENKTGADITLVAGTKISYDFRLPAAIKPPQLSWDNKTWIEDEPGSYMSTAIYFLSYNLYEFAEVCLARELERVGTKTLVWVYYLSVCHYIQGRYEDSAKHLSKAIAEVNDYNMDPRIWILLGHNCWMMGFKKCAIQMYIQAFTKKKIVLYEHMTFIRAGFFFLEHEQAKFAKQMFLRAVRQQGTPMGWLGLGISLFMEGKMEDAELALREANMLDTTMPTAWGYLALISLYKLKQDQFLHCYREAKRYGLNDEKLALEIEMISQQISSHKGSRHFGKWQ